MSPLPRQAIARVLRVMGCVVLVALLAFSLIAAGSPPSHAHVASHAGIYNADCPLAALAAFHGSSLPSGLLSSAWIALVAAVVTLRGSEADRAAPTRRTDPRAPPAPSC